MEDRVVPLDEWARTENAKERVCGCGCGRKIRVLPLHRARGIPDYIRAHHPSAMTHEIAELRASGFLTTAQVAAGLGIGRTTVLRLEGVAYSPPPRVGVRRLRVFSIDDVGRLRAWLDRRGASRPRNG